MTTVAVRLPDELVNELDRLVSEGAYRTRTEAVRVALESFVDEQRQQSLDASIVSGYRRVPPPEPDPWTVAQAVRSIEEEPW